MKSKYILTGVFTVFVLISGLIYQTSANNEKVSYKLEKTGTELEQETGPRNDVVKAENELDNDASITQPLLVDTSQDATLSGDKIYVYVYGAVKKPGVYEVESSLRVFQILEMASGLADDAAEGSVNLARHVSDGESIYFPTIEEAETIASVEETLIDDGRININLASESELENLPGIGDTKAKSIVAYRTLNGQFLTIEEIMQVSGIKESLYDSLRTMIKVK